MSLIQTQADYRSIAIARTTRRFVRPFDRTPRGPRVNERIRISPIRLIDENEEMVGVVETEVALRRAREAGLDLVEISPGAEPPVCRILDFGKFKYEESKKERAGKSKTKSELKEVRLGRSMKIDPHDVEIRCDQARRFLLEGHKVQIVQNIKGREMLHKDRGVVRMAQIIEQMADVAKVEVPPRFQGRRITMILAPERAKVEQYKRRAAAAAGKAAKRAAPPAAAVADEPAPSPAVEDLAAVPAPTSSG